MAERKTAILSISKGLFNVSLATLAAIGSATGNIWLAGATALPLALSASGTLRPLLEKQPEVQLVLPVPRWWTGDVQSWQAVCSSIENQLPTIMQEVAENLQHTQVMPTAPKVQQVLREVVMQHLSAWDVKAQDRALIAGYVTPPVLEKSAQVLKIVIDPMREDALANILAKVVTMLDEVQKQDFPFVSPATSHPVGETVPGLQKEMQIPSEDQSISVQLEYKRQNRAYDVYICYDEADEAAVMKIGEQLKGYGILPWFDEIDVQPGTLRAQQQEEQIENIPAAAIFVGQYAVANWQALQMYSFLGQFVERKCPVIPILLADAPLKPKLPVYLANFQWVDFRRQQPEPIGQLLWGITGKRQKR